MSYPRIWKWFFAIMAVVSILAVVAGSVVAAPAESGAGTKSQQSSPSNKASASQSGGFFSWLTHPFSSSPEERAAREAELRAQADARSKELAKAIAAEKDGNKKAALEVEAKKHADKEASRRAAFDEKVKRDAERKAAEDARLKAKEEARAKAEADKKARAEQEAKDAAARVVARETLLRAQADARSKEFAVAIAAATDDNAKAKLENEARKHAEREAARRAEVEADVKRAAERKAAEAARVKAREDSRAKAEADKKARVEQEAMDAKARSAAKESELKARAEQEEKTQADRAAVLAAKLKAREEANAKADAEAKARSERELKERVDAAAVTAAERKAREESRVNAELERRAIRESGVRARIVARAKELADAIAKADDPEEKAGLQKESDELAASETARRAAVAARDADLKTRWEARSKVLDERAKYDIERAMAQPNEMPKWRFSAGAIHRVINSQTFKSGSYSQSYPIPAKSRNTTYTYDPASDTASIADRDYIDGYVHMDDWTGLDGGTWNWGYENGSQVKNDSVVLKWLQKSRTEFTRNTVISTGERERDSDGNAGVYVRAERVLKQAGPVDCGVRLDASRVAYSSSGTATTFSDQQRWASYRQYTEDSYLLAGTGITPASSPYQGTVETPGPTINNTPDSRVSGKGTKVSSGSYDAYNSVDESFSMDLSTVSLGMSLAGHCRRLYVSGAMGPTLTIVDTDASYYEALYESSNGGAPSLLASWRDSNRDTEYNVGFFVQGELGLRLIRGLEMSVFGRYDWIENVSGSVGQMRYVANPEGGSVGGTLNYAF